MFEISKFLLAASCRELEFLAAHMRELNLKFETYEFQTSEYVSTSTLNFVFDIRSFEKS